MNEFNRNIVFLKSWRGEKNWELENISNFKSLVQIQMTLNKAPKEIFKSEVKTNLVGAQFGGETSASVIGTIFLHMYTNTIQVCTMLYLTDDTYLCK